MALNLASLKKKLKDQLDADKSQAGFQWRTPKQRQVSQQRVSNVKNTLQNKVVQPVSRATSNITSNFQNRVQSTSPARQARINFVQNNLIPNAKRLAPATVHVAKQPFAPGKDGSPSFVRSFTRTVPESGMSINRAITGKEPELRNRDTKVSNFLFGKSPLKSHQLQAATGGKQTLMDLGVNEQNAQRAIPFLAGAGFAMDVVPVGLDDLALRGGRKTLPKGAKYIDDAVDVANKAKSRLPSFRVDEAIKVVESSASTAKKMKAFEVITEAKATAPKRVVDQLKNIKAGWSEIDKAKALRDVLKLNEADIANQAKGEKKILGIPSNEFKSQSGKINLSAKVELPWQKKQPVASLPESSKPIIQQAEKVFEESETEAADAVAKEFFDSAQPGGIKRIGYEFNRIFSPLKNMPQDSRATLVNWRNSVLESKKSANNIYQELSKVEPKIGGDNYSWLKTIENPKLQKNLAPDAQKYITEVRGILDAKRAEGLEAGLPIGYLDNYLNHVWEQPYDQIQKQMAKGISSRPGLTKAREIPNYTEGIEMGLTPRFTSPAQLVAHYDYQIKKAIANKKLAEELVATKRLLPESAARKMGVFDWQTIDSPFFPRASRVVDKDGTRVVENYVAPRDVALPLKNIFEDKTGNFFLRGGSWVSKKMQDVTLSGGVPYTAVNAFSLANTLKEVTAGRIVSPIHAGLLSFSKSASNKYLAKNSDTIQKMARDGIDIRAVDYDAATKKLGQVFKESKIEGIDQVWNSAITDPTFKRFLPILQVNYYNDIYNKAVKSGLKGRAAEEEAAKATKMFYGTISEFSRSKNTNDALSAVLFAPAWRESMLNFWTNNVRSLSPKNLVSSSARTNQKYLVGTMITLGIYDALNRKLNDGRSMFDNKEGKELYLEIPRENGRSWFISFQPSVLTVPRRALEITSNLLAGDPAAATSRAATLLSQPLNLAGQIGTNQTFYGQPIYGEDDNTGQKIKKMAGYALEQSSHPYIGEPMAVKQGRKTPTEAGLAMLELPVYPSKSTTVSHLTTKQIAEYNEIAASEGQQAADEYSKEKLLKKMGYDDYVLSDDAPITKADRRNLTFKSAVANPIETTKLAMTGEPIRKLDTPEGNPLKFFDSATVSERRKNMSDLDQGDKTTQVDHIMPKWLGGREEKKNLQSLSNEEHKVKTALDNKLREQFLAGDVSKNDARKQIADLNKTLNGQPIEDNQWLALTEPDSEVVKEDNKAELISFNGELPTDIAKLEDIYSDMRKDIDSYESKKQDILYSSRTEESRTKALSKLETDYKYAQSIVQKIGNEKPEQIKEIELNSGINNYKSGGGALVEDRAIWVKSQLDNFTGTDEQRKALIDRLWDEKVITSGTSGVAAALAEMGTQVGYGSGSGGSGGRSKKIKLGSTPQYNAPEYRQRRVSFKSPGSRSSSRLRFTSSNSGKPMRIPINLASYQQKLAKV